MQESDAKDETLIGDELKPSTSKAPTLVKAYVAPIPFSQRLHKQKLDSQFGNFLEVFEKLYINIPFADALAQMPTRLKIKDPGSFTIPCSIGDLNFSKALCDFGASINLMPLSIFKKLGLGEAKATTMSLQLADRSIKYSRGFIEDVLVKVDKFIFPAYFIILDMEEDHAIFIILGWPFLTTDRALIDVQEGQLILRVQDEQVTFNILKRLSKDPLETCLECPLAIKEKDFEVGHMVHYLEATHSQSYKRAPNYEDLEKSSSLPLPSLQQAPILYLKPLPSHLRYAYSGESSMLLGIIANFLSELEEE
ncbi:uncharacterized protein LOC111388065 [Olea europaea var. sylvestris]|uniref:uncharacterized protein LOC111388065 n=1 Tax=Olea europaea var. sylvestris TaxID=158386 RepID=UPI000C1CFA72|nr:uncharacterized protein LOC111388065 [Olea europaea var. sylvestris]